jgi:hypothetical protein
MLAVSATGSAVALAKRTSSSTSIGCWPDSVSIESWKKRSQKHNIVHESFGRDAAELIAAIKLVLGDRRGHRPWRAIAIATVIGLLLTAALLGYSQGIIPWIGPSGQQQSSKTNDATIAALPNSDAARKVEETRQKAEADAKVASDAASKKAAGVAQDACGVRKSGRARQYECDG